MPQDRDTGPDAARAAAHAGIEHLMDTLLPSLIAKLATLNVGELEVHEGDWRVRLRHPMSAGQDFGRRATDRSGQRAHAGHEAVGAPAPARALATGVVAGATTAAPNGSLPALSPVGPGRTADGPPARDPGPGIPVPRGPIATSPAVGIFQPGSAAVAGARVKAGERLGAVDILGIPQDVVAPADGIVTSILVEGGTAVEYGQELVGIEATAGSEAR